MADPDPLGPPPGSLCREIETTLLLLLPSGVVSGPCTGEGVQEEGDLLTPGPNQRG